MVDNVNLKINNLEKRAERGVRELREGIAPSRPISRLFFETKIRETETFFLDQIFSRLILRLFLRPNVFETDTETFL